MFPLTPVPAADSIRDPTFARSARQPLRPGPAQLARQPTAEVTAQHVQDPDTESAAGQRTPLGGLDDWPRTIPEVP